MAAPDTNPRDPILIGFLKLAETFSVAAACFGGGILAMLAFFITFDALGRAYGGLYSGATDEISGYAMSFAVAWTLAYTLTMDKHVRVDLIFGALPTSARRFLDRVALLLLTVFAVLLAVNSFRMAMESYQYNIFSPSTLRMPLVYPQMLMAIGFGILALQGTATFLAGLLYPSALKRAASAERKSAPTQYEI